MILTEDEKNEIKSVLYQHIDLNCIFRCNPDQIYCEDVPVGKLPSQTPKPKEKESDTVLYLRRLTSNPKLLEYVCALFFDDIMNKIKNDEEYGSFQIAGLETSSMPIITGMQMYALKFGLEINSFSIRKSRKDYGLGHLINGIPNKERVLFVDDLFNSGSSLNACLETCFWELELESTKNSYVIYNNNPTGDNTYFYEGDTININSIFMKKEFDLNYSKEKYWLPQDCDRSYNKRPDYK